MGADSTAGKAAGIPSWAQLSVHSLRHTGITLALDAGATLREVQDYAGHRDPRTTRRYETLGNCTRRARNHRSPGQHGNGVVSAVRV
jgi:integrase